MFVNAISSVRRLAAILKRLGLPVQALHAGGEGAGVRAEGELKRWLRCSCLPYRAASRTHWT